MIAGESPESVQYEVMTDRSIDQVTGGIFQHWPLLPELCIEQHPELIHIAHALIETAVITVGKINGIQRVELVYIMHWPCAFTESMIAHEDNDGRGG